MELNPEQSDSQNTCVQDVQDAAILQGTVFFVLLIIATLSNEIIREAHSAANQLLSHLDAFPATVANFFLRDRLHRNEHR